MSATVGTKYINTASTQKKIIILAKTNPRLAAFAQGLFIDNGFGNQSLQDALKSLDRISKNAIITMFAPEIQKAEQEGANTRSNSTSVSPAQRIQGFTEDVVTEIRGLKENLNEALKPVSSWTGQAFANLTDVVANPLGAVFSVPIPLMALIDRVSPEFADRLDASIKKFKLNEIQNLPSNVMGGLRSLAATIDEKLSIVFEYAADLYNGLLEIMNSIADLIDAAIASVFDFIFGPDGLLDSIFPFTEILEFLNELNDLAGFIGGITNAFTGLEFVNSALSQVTNYTSQIQGILQNPQQLIQAYIPPEINQITSILRNPQQFIGKLIPPEVSAQLSKIGSIPGLGFVGNLGYGIEGVLQLGTQGIATTIFNEFSNQVAILNPLFNKQDSANMLTDPKASYPPQLQGSPFNPSKPVNQGIPVQLQEPPRVISSGP